jgi:thimet oligopeptidase
VFTVHRASLLVLVSALASACGAAPADPVTPPPAPPAPLASATAPMPSPAPRALAPIDVDPVAVGLTAEGVTRLCDDSLARAAALLDEVRALSKAKDDALTWDATLGKLDLANLALRNGSDFPGLMAVAHPDKAVRDAAKACEPKIDKFSTSLYLDADLASVFKRYAAKKESLSGPRARLLAHTLRDYRRNGLELPADKQPRLRELNEQITKLSQDFEQNLAESTLTLEVEPKALEGLPGPYVDAHKPQANGKVKLTTDYPDVFPFLQYAKDRKAALELFKKFDDRAADKNVAILEKVLALRAEKAKLLGYATWADYVIEPRMAKDAKTVAAFLDGLKAHLAKAGKSELAELVAMHVKLGGKATDDIPPSDRSYLEDQVRSSKYGLDSKEVSKYFEVTKVKKGILEITAKLFGVQYRPFDGPKWHPDVEPMEILDGGGKVIGRFYFDLSPRDGKYKHAAVFGIRETKKLDDGTRLQPIAAIVCNFPQPGKGTPALMSHSEVTTFFHEFGHVLHHLLSEAELATFAGTAVARDFVESPSQMLEEWAWSKETLAMFARHHETDAPLPDALFDAITASRAFGRSVSTQRQLFLAALDQQYHVRAPGFDSTKVFAEIHDAYMPFKHVEGTHFQATFGHLMGYDAGYYGYQWALSIARDLFTRFEKEGMMNPKTAADYRAAVLAPGGSDDEAKMVERFLGRAPSDEAYKRFLSVKSPAGKAKAAGKAKKKLEKRANRQEAKLAKVSPLLLTRAWVWEPWRSWRSWRFNFCFFG